MKKILILIILMFLVILPGCKENVDEGKNDFYNDYSHYLKVVPDGWDWFDLAAYTNMLDHSVFTKRNFSEIKNALEGNEKVVIYFGYNPKLYECPYCAIALPILNEAALESDVEEILYLDIYQIRKDYENGLENENSESYKWLLDFITSQIPDFGEKILVPDIFVIENGKILSHHTATFMGEDGKYIKDLSVEEKQNLKEIYLDMLK